MYVGSSVAVFFLRIFSQFPSSFLLSIHTLNRGGLRFPHTARIYILNEAEQLPIFPTFSWKISIVGLHSWPVWWRRGGIMAHVVVAGKGKMAPL